MQITTKTEYAIRALAELALNNNQKPLSIREICVKQNLPQKYIEQIFRRLKKRGFLRSVHGAHGGYFLNIAPADLTLFDIMQGVEENYHSVKCEKKDKEPTYCNGRPCGFYTFWQDVTSHLTTYFKGLKLQDILDNLGKEGK